MEAQAYLRNLLSQYYSSLEVNSVPEISMREFGFGEFGKKISSRHLSFASSRALNSFLREKTPFYISYSNALYELPSARPMEAKKMVGADLIYEFDADDLKTSCKLSHDSWKCASCAAAGKGNIKACPECGSGTNVDEWVCPECLEEVKGQTARLIRALEGDFGFSQGLSINFSGSKGFHVHIRSEKIRGFSRAARLELLDYLTGTNLDLKSLGFAANGKLFLCPKKGSANGWSKALLEGIEGIVEEGDVGKIAELGREGLPKKNPVGAVQKLLKEKPRIISNMARGLLIGGGGVNASKFWPGILGSLAEGNSLGVDRQTSIDINKIIRVPQTLHGSTCLLAKSFEPKSLGQFDALKESVVLADREIKLAGASSPKFYLGGKWFGPFEDQEVSLPLFAGAFLLARKSARLG